MKRILSFATLSLASLAFACGTEAPVDEDGTIEESNDELTKREAQYLGDYKAKPGTIDEIQSLSLKTDNTFTGSIASHLIGNPIVCIKAPCTLTVNGKWTAVKTWQGRILLRLQAQTWKGVSEIAYYVSENPGHTLVLRRSPNIVIALDRAFECPIGLPAPPACPAGQKLKSKQDANGCFAGYSCEDVICPLGLPAPPKCVGPFEQPVAQENDHGCFYGYKCISCPQIEPNPIDLPCNGNWVSKYTDSGCFLGTVCEPIPQACPQVEPNPPWVKCDAAGKTWSRHIDANGCFLGTSCVDRAQDSCVISGCNGEICAPKAMASICLADPAAAKYIADGVLCKKTAGTCGWVFPTP